MSISPQSIKLINNIEFERNGEITKFDKNTFKDKATMQFFVENNPFILKSFRSPDTDLADCTIIKLKDCNSSYKMCVLIQASALPCFSNVQGISKISNTVFGGLLSEMHESFNKMLSDLSEALRQKEKAEFEFKITQQAQIFQNNLTNAVKSLEEEITLSGLNENQKALIQDNAAGVYLTQDFLHLKDKLPKNTTVIGLNYKQILLAMCDVLGFECYIDAYDRIYHTILAQPDFMEKLTNENHPVLFLVPRNLFGPKQGITAGEMQWLLDHPKFMNLVTFVFGAYKAYPKKILDIFLEYCVAKRIFQQIQAK